MNTLVIQDFTDHETEMMSRQPQFGIHSFREREIEETRTKTAQDIAQEFLRMHPNARILPGETIKGVPLIIDESRKNLEGIVGFTGIAYPVFNGMYDAVPSGYAFYAVHVDTQISTSHILSESVS
jgi:hypothetical protein